MDSRTPAAPILEIDRVTKRFGGLTALDEVSFRVDAGEIRGLIGPNGAGKTTVFKNIAGFYTPTSGDIRKRFATAPRAKARTMPATMVAMSGVWCGIPAVRSSCRCRIRDKAHGRGCQPGMSGPA